MSNTQQHPDLAALDMLRTGEGDAADARHVDACTACQHSLAELSSAAQRFKDNTPGAVAIPPDIEARILWQARKRAAAIRRRPRHVPQWAAAAAVLLAIAGLAVWRVAPQPASAPMQMARSDDWNGDGKFDILDAFALARAVDHADSKDAVRFDSGDIDALARRAVSLSGSGA